MAIISSKDLDRQMDQGVDLTKAPVRSRGGADEGAMEGVIQRGTDHRVQSSQATHRGAPVYSPDEVAPTGFYGSATVISVNESEMIDESSDPAMGRKGVPPVIILPPPAKAVVQAAPAPVAAAPQPKVATTADLLAKMGLRK